MANKKKKAAPVKPIKKPAAKKAVKPAKQKPVKKEQAKVVKLKPKANSKSKDVAVVKIDDKLKADNVFPKNRMLSLSELTKLNVRDNAHAIVVESDLVQIVKKGYGHLPNEKFFMEVERVLMEAGLKYSTSYINRDNTNFAVDYILTGDADGLIIKNGKDIVFPTLRAANSYDGGNTSCRFGFFRPMNSVTLFPVQFKIGFGLNHYANIVEDVVKEINNLASQFGDPDYKLTKEKFNTLADKSIMNVAEFVKEMAKSLSLFQFHESGSDAPSEQAAEAIRQINGEAELMGVKPNYWIAYNIISSIIHGDGTTFKQQRNNDSKAFDLIYQLATSK